MGINCYPLAKDVDYTLCIEILKRDYQLWHKTVITINKTSSQRLRIGNVSVNRFSHRFFDQFVYYHRVIVSFKKRGGRMLHIVLICWSIFPKTGTIY